MGELTDKIISTPLRGREKEYRWDYFGVDVLLTEVSHKEFMELTTRTIDIQSKKVKSTYIAEKIIMCVKEPGSRQPVFTAANRDFIMSLPQSALNDISAEIERLHTLTEADVEDAVKN